MIRSSVAARSFVPSSFDVAVNGATIRHAIPAVNPSYIDTYAHDFDGLKTAMFNALGSAVNVTYTYNQPVAGSIGWLDFFEINSRAFLTLNQGGQRYFFDAETVGAGNITRFDISSAEKAHVWDVTDPTTPVSQDATFSGGISSFVTRTDSLKA